MQLRAMRIRKGKQQKELAKAIGTDEPMMSKFENYKCLPIPPMMTALCRELGCEVEDILRILDSNTQARTILTGLTIMSGGIGRISRLECGRL